MAPGTRSRRTDVLHRATPVMLKSKQRQTTLDQHLQQTRQLAPGAASSTRPPLSHPPLQAPSRQPRALQQHKTPTAAPKQHQKQQKQQKQQQTTPPSRQQTLFSFAVSPPTRNLSDNTDHAESMSSARPKRKAAVDADADARGGDAAKREKAASAAAAAPASGGFSSVSAVEESDAIMGVIVSDDSLEEALRKRPRLAVEILDFAKAPTTLQQQHYTLVGQGSQATKPTGKAENTSKHSTASHPRPLSPLSPPALRSLAANNTNKSSANTGKNTNTTPSFSSTQQAASATPKTRQHPIASQKQARDKAESSTTIPQTAAAAGTSTTQPRALKAAPKSEPHPASKSKEKLVNGIKHELKSLQLTASDAVDTASVPREGGRKLRSQEATRFKSELSAYFPEYDEVIGNEPKEEHVLNLDTPMLFVEQSTAHPAQYSPPTLSAPLVASLRGSDYMAATPSPVKGYGDKLFYDVFDSHVLDFTFLGSQYKNKGAVDPLPDTCFEANHRRAERMERSIRNTEKGRAQHEKDQIIRLLDGLQGPDWLRTMGVSGITESKKKAFEPARDHFIRGCRTILDKFRTWSLEEKRRKMEKDRAHAEEVKAREAAAAASSAAATAEPRAKYKAKADTVGGKSRKRVSGKEPPNKKSVRAKSARDEAAPTSEPADTDGDEAAAVGAATGDDDDDESIDDDSQPDSSDFDAVIAHQLREEALARSRVASKLSQGPSALTANKRRKTQQPPPAKDASSPYDPTPLAEEPKEAKEPKEVKSFFEKPYQREAALSRSRRKGRTVMAWGQPVPEPTQTEFRLPGEVMDKDKDKDKDKDVEPESKETGRRTRGSARSTKK